MATAATKPTTPAAGPALCPQLSGWLSAVNKAVATQGEANHTAVNAVPPSAAGASGTSSPPAAVAHVNQILSQANSQQAFDLPSDVLSQETVARQSLSYAAQALPQDDEPPKGKTKLKSRMRRALLRKFLLKTMLGKTLADWVYPWIHPKARSRSTM